jgi:hypothetical protein
MSCCPKKSLCLTIISSSIFIPFDVIVNNSLNAFLAIAFGSPELF